MEEIKKLYDQLMQFKSSDNFIRFGFAAAGENKNWLNEVIALKNRSIDIKKKILLGHIEVLGFNYVGSRGKENELTIESKKIINKTIK